MTPPKGASVAINELRNYADFLAGPAGPSSEPTASRRPSSADDGCAGRIRDLINKLEERKIPVEAWGMPNGSIGPPTLEVDPDQRVHIGDGDFLTSFPAPEHYVKFKNAYEAAHQAMVDRLENLAQVYESTAEAYRDVAHAYDIMNETDKD